VPFASLIGRLSRIDTDRLGRIGRTTTKPDSKSAAGRQASQRRAGVAFVKALPVFIASDPVWATRRPTSSPADRRPGIWCLVASR
jgi:hypothetical protein